MSEVAEIRYLTDWKDVDSENENIDVHVRLDDGRVYGFLVATPNNIFWSMGNEGIDYYFGTPVLFVKLLNKECVEKAIHAVVTEDNGRWLDVYGTLQRVGCYLKSISEESHFTTIEDKRQQKTTITRIPTSSYSLMLPADISEQYDNR